MNQIDFNEFSPAFMDSIYALCDQCDPCAEIPFFDLFETFCGL